MKYGNVLATTKVPTMAMAQAVVRGQMQGSVRYTQANIIAPDGKVYRWKKC
jgi:hypothetical protein